ncbi:MAG: family 43 glycosylhydrolase [Eubacterium sp.]
MKTKKLLSVILTLIMLITATIIPCTADAAESKNPVLDGSYADPDIDWFDCKFWIFPTTDGIIDERDGWWGSKQFKAFSSEDMVNWTDNGVILDVEADTAEEAGVNENGVQIAYSPWSYGHAWAPTIEKVGDKYFFYYVAGIKPEYMEKYGALTDTLDEDGNVVLDGEGNPIQHYIDDKAIGVAYASSPTGPYTALDEPIVYPKMLQDNFKDGAAIPSVIDPSIFIDDDGTAYMTFGNWVPCIVQLSDDMLSADTSFLKVVTGIPTGWWSTDSFMESLVIFKRDGKYYFTWSSDGTASEDYRVCYATTNNIKYRVSYQGTLLKKDASKGIYGTGHQSILYLPTNDSYYISYGRLQTNADGTLRDNADRGNYREVCIDKIEFDSFGAPSVTPTNSGVGAVSPHTISSSAKSTSVNPASLSKNGAVTKNYYCTECGKLFPKVTVINKISTVSLSSASYTYDGKVKKPSVKVADSKGKTISSNNYTVTYAGGRKNVGKYAVKITFKGNYSGTKTLYFTIKPKATSISSVSAKSKGFTVKWKKQSTQVTGYQIQYSTSSRFTSPKTVTVSNYKTTSKTISKLKSKKKYYVRIRTYKTVNGTKYYSSWSKAKSITTKK